MLAKSVSEGRFRSEVVDGSSLQEKAPAKIKRLCAKLIYRRSINFARQIELSHVVDTRSLGPQKLIQDLIEASKPGDCDYCNMGDAKAQ